MRKTSFQAQSLARPPQRSADSKAATQKWQDFAGALEHEWLKALGTELSGQPGYGDHVLALWQSQTDALPLLFNLGVATLFLDNRSGVVGHDGSRSFERAVSLAATVGKLLAQKGFALHLATVDSPATLVDETRLLEILASVSAVRTRSIGESLRALRATARADTSLALVTAPPPANEVQSLLRIGSGFGRKLAIFVYPASLVDLPSPAANELEARATSARSALQHAGWDVFMVEPDGRFSEVWQTGRNKKLRLAGSLS